MLTDVIFAECQKYADKRGSRTSEEEMSRKLKELSPEIIDVSSVPSNEELKKKYKIRDLEDMKILYSVEMTNSVILVTLDDDFSDVDGLRAKIMRPGEYLYERNGGGKHR